MHVWKLYKNSGILKNHLTSLPKFCHKKNWAWNEYWSDLIEPPKKENKHCDSVEHTQWKTENICIRFSHLSERIFDSLDNQNLNTCKEASRFWFHFLDGQKFVQIRIIRATVKQFHSVGKSWSKVFNSASTETIMVLGDMVDQFYKKDSDLEYHDELTPMHTAAATGNLFLLTKIQKKSLEKFCPILKVS